MRKEKPLISRKIRISKMSHFKGKRRPESSPDTKRIVRKKGIEYMRGIMDPEREKGKREKEERKK